MPVQRNQQRFYRRHRTDQATLDLVVSTLLSIQLANGASLSCFLLPPLLLIPLHASEHGSFIGTSREIIKSCFRAYLKTADCFHDVGDGILVRISSGHHF